MEYQSAKGNQKTPYSDQRTEPFKSEPCETVWQGSRHFTSDDHLIIYSGRTIGPVRVAVILKKQTKQSLTMKRYWRDFLPYILKQNLSEHLSCNSMHLQ
ncbi:hypothetical protein PoB_000487900 [Plakobranchus ocellatus]|uniref:Uncharacterized protein n=1 Tax=Plakobranchus ocellatus TaxID=259542 RepID=A0AAV3Y617_9GAST|nr:hypothetical protein PoB_000487900 [Plakobranchus ocellatus]